MRPNRDLVAQAWWAALALAMGGLLVGCSTPTSPVVAPGATVASSSASSSSSGSPAATRAATTSESTTSAHAGSCWDATAKALSGWTWDGSPSVACDGSHNAETIYAGTLTAGETAPYTSVPGAYESVVTSACDDERLSALFRAEVVSNPDLWTSARGPSARPVEVAVSYYFPTAREWAAGERWFRCDAGAARPGSTPWPTLTTSFGTALASGSDAFDYCLDGIDPGTGRSARSAVPVGSVAPCSATSPWKLVAVVQLRHSAKERFPGASSASARATRLCPAGSRAGHVQVPDAFSWNANRITYAQCWERPARQKA